MQCPKCGYAMDDFAVECERCKRMGQPAQQAEPEPPLQSAPLPQPASDAEHPASAGATAPSAAAARSVVMEQPTPLPEGYLNCPMCSNDAVVKVSAVVASEASSLQIDGNVSAGWHSTGAIVTPGGGVAPEAGAGSVNASVSLAGSQTTKLARALAPPTPPIAPSRVPRSDQEVAYAAIVACGIALAAILLGWGLARQALSPSNSAWDAPRDRLPLVVAQGGSSGPHGSWGHVFVDTTLDAREQRVTRALFALGFLTLIATGIVAAAAYGPLLMRGRCARAEEQADCDVAYLTATARWRRSLALWNELFYCPRCDTVFDPRTGASAPSASVRALLDHLVSQSP